MKLFSNLFGKPSQPSSCIMKFEGDENKLAEETQTAAGNIRVGMTDGETLDKVYEEFCTTVCHKPDINLMATIRAERIPPLEKWLHWKNNNAETMAFLTLMVDATRKDIKIWEQKGIHAFHDGGDPPRDSIDALATLAQIMEMPIKLFFQDKHDEMKVWDFDP